MLLFIAPSILFITGVVMYKFPPKNINFLYGYKTPSSMKSQERWDFAQIYSAKKLMLGGALTGLLGLINYLLNIGVTEIFQTIVLLIVVVYIIAGTEITLKRRFK